MSEVIENTFTSYLGTEFQQSLMWQILVEPEFAERIIPDMNVEYFDDPNLKRLFIIIEEYFHEFNKPANLQNQSIFLAINKYKTPNNVIEEESLFAVVERINQWNERVINQNVSHNGEAIQKEATGFIKQQEYRKLGEFILNKTRSGEIRQKTILGTIEEKIVKITRIGDTEDIGTSVLENIKKALGKEFRQTVPTGITVIDALTGGGLGKGEVGIILSPSGVGKTTTLTKIANTAYEGGENVLQIIFEDTEDQIKRKHYTIWTKIPLSELESYPEEEVERRVLEHEMKRSANGGRLIIKKFSQENTTMIDIRNWIVRYQKKFGYKFTLITLDYLDCLESHKKNADRNEAELTIVKSFLALADDFNIPAWSAIQSNRSGFDAELVEVQQMGGNVKRIQKAHFFMSIAKPPSLKEADLANVKIIKARFAKDGQIFMDSIFNNNTLEIRLNDDNYHNKYSNGLHKVTDSEIEKLNNDTLISDMAGKYAQISNQTQITPNTEFENSAPKFKSISVVENDLVGETESYDNVPENTEIPSNIIKFEVVDTPTSNVNEQISPIIDIEIDLIDADELENNEETTRKMFEDIANNQHIRK